MQDKIISKEISFVEDNLFNQPKECAKILSNISVEALEPRDQAFYFKQVGIQALNEGNYFTAYKHFQKSIDISKLHSYTKLVDAGNINLSAVFHYTKQYQKAIHHAFKALRAENKNIQSYACQNLATNYELIHDYDKALFYNEKAIAITAETEFPNLGFAAFINSGNIMAKLGENKKALNFFEKALDCIQQTKSVYSYSDAYIYLAAFYTKNLKFIKAHENAKIALKYAQEYSINRNFSMIYWVLINSAYHLNYFDKMRAYIEDYDDLNFYSGDDHSHALIFDLKIKIEEESENISKALIAAKEKIKFLKKREEKEKQSFELYTQFKEDENEKIVNINEKLFQTNSELVNIAKILAHDLKTPIRTLSSFSNLLRKEISDSKNKNTEEYLDYISNSAATLYMKLEIAIELIFLKLNYPLEKINVNDLIFKLKDEFPGLTIYVQESLPFMWSNLVIMRKFFKCIFNNSLNYTKNENPKIIISAEQVNNTVIIEMKDNGDGIADDHINNVFDLFYSTEPRVKNGAGLSICKKICALHGGSISVKANKDKGITLTATFLNKNNSTYYERFGQVKIKKPLH